MNFQALKNERLHAINEIYLNGRKDECGEIKELLRGRPKRKLAFLDVVQRETTQYMQGDTNYIPPHLQKQAIKGMWEVFVFIAFGFVIAAFLVLATVGGA